MISSIQNKHAVDSTKPTIFHEEWYGIVYFKLFLMFLWDTNSGCTLLSSHWVSLSHQLDGNYPCHEKHAKQWLLICDVLEICTIILTKKINCFYEKVLQKQVHSHTPNIQVKNWTIIFHISLMFNNSAMKSKRNGCCPQEWCNTEEMHTVVLSIAEKTIRRVPARSKSPSI